MNKTYSILILLFAFKCLGQDIERKDHYAFWTYHQKNVNTHGISFGLGSFDQPMNNYTNGLKVELIGLGILLPLAPKSPIAGNDEFYEKLMQEPLSERVNGIVLSGAGTVCDCNTNGINIGLIGHFLRQVNGLSVALFGNVIQKSNGMQAAIFNDSFYSNGLQFGAANYSYHTNGLQIGLWNTSKNLKGIQIGLWNENQRRKLPLINWNFKDHG